MWPPSFVKLISDCPIAERFRNCVWKSLRTDTPYNSRGWKLAFTSAKPGVGVVSFSSRRSDLGEVGPKKCNTALQVFQKLLSRRSFGTVCFAFSQKRFVRRNTRLQPLDPGEGISLIFCVAHAAI